MISIPRRIKAITKSSPNRTIYTAILTIAFILPWPHGGEITRHYLFFSTIIFGLAAIFAIGKIKSSKQSLLTASQIRFPIIALGLWLLYQILQVIPLPVSLANIAEQKTNEINWQSISIATNITLVEIIKHTSYITVFILSLLVLKTKKRKVVLANTLFISSAIIAIYSLVNHYSKGAFDLISSIPPWTVSWEKAAHGTFSYQNHYASFLTLTIPLGFGLIYSKSNGSNPGKVRKHKLQKVIALVMSINTLYLLGLLIMFTALFKTASRGGNTIFLISIVITFFCMLLMQNKTKKEKVKKIVFAIFSLLAIGLIVTATGVTGTLTKRLESQGYNPNGRTLMHQTALSILEERPLVGTGAGTYPILQHKYKSHKLGPSEMSKRAHNEYLELLANQGVIGFSLLAMATLLLLITLFKGLKENLSLSNKPRSLYGLQVACFCSVISILLHSLVDFNFHLPANAVYYYLILALGISCQTIKKPEQQNTV